MRCYGNTRNAWQPPGPPHALRMPAKTPLASDKLDAPAACATLSATTPFHFARAAGGVVTRTRNVSEYMLILALCLVSNINPPESVQRSFTKRLTGMCSLSYESRLKALGLERLELRRLCMDLIACYNVVYGLVSTPFVRVDVDAAYCYRLSIVVCLSVCRSVTLESPAKMAEPIELPFRLRTRVGPGNHELYGV